MRLILTILTMALSLCATAQEEFMAADSIDVAAMDSVIAQQVDSVNRTLQMPVTTTKTGKRNWAEWTPSPKRAMWLAMVLPGAGQIYNRKYWKLPIFYGGFLGCFYAMEWNNQMYADYSKAYLDLMDDDPATQSYNDFMHLGAAITDANKSMYEQRFKRRKDYYRRYRDLSFFCIIGVYALSIIDAYVDAQLSAFDISEDLTLRVRPTTISNQGLYASHNPLKNTALGVQCSFGF